MHEYIIRFSHNIFDDTLVVCDSFSVLSNFIIVKI